MYLHLYEKAVFGQIKGYNGSHTGLLSIPFMYYLHLNEKAVFGQIKGYNGLHTGLGTSFVMYLHLKGKAVLGQIKGLLSIPFMYYLHSKVGILYGAMSKRRQPCTY